MIPSRFLLASLSMTILYCGCAGPNRSEIGVEMAQRNLIVDTHIDAPYRLYRNLGNILERDETREFDVPRALEGGLNVVFMSIYTPASAALDGTSRNLASELIDMTESIAAESDSVGIVTCTDDVYQLQKLGKLSFALGMENGSPLEGEVENLAHFVERGVRYITLAHSKSNEFSDSSYDENEPWEGLSPAGKQLVSAMQQHGVMIDISHLSDRASWQVLELAKAPVIASHSSLRHFIPEFHRNMPDDMVVAMAQNGGVVQINFGSGFISEESRDWSDQRYAALEKLQEQSDMTEDEIREFFDTYAESNPYPYASVSTVVDHIDRVVQLAGIDHVGLGSDFDGVGDTLPFGLKNVAHYPNLIVELLERGYNKSDISKILGGNLMRAWRENETYAEAHGNQVQCSQLAVNTN